MPSYIVLLGPPGAGKGTQAEMISDVLDLPHISSGDIFRENTKNQTELGKLADRYIARGELVPDDVTIGMIRERLSRQDCEKGAILDGFPRTPSQAEALDEMLIEFNGRVDVVPFISVPDDELVKRLSDRWTCRAEGHVFHEIYNPPKKEGICDFDGSELYQRIDDKPATVERRIHVYKENTRPLVEYYRSHQVLKEIDGTQSIELVTRDILAVIMGKEKE
jgi:adenylate kinase